MAVRYQDLSDAELSNLGALDAFAVTPNDSANFTATARALFVGGAGNVSLVTAAGNTVLFTGVTAGSVLPVLCTRVNGTGTTSTNIVALV